jgi:alanine dehydrogenase
MRVGVPREIKPLEGRVALVPEACTDLIAQGHEVFVEQGAGALSGFPDQDYLQRGVRRLPDAAAVFEKAELLVKVKEPLGAELALLTAEHVLFCFLHLAANPVLTEGLQRIGLTAIAFETVEEQGALPILAPMSNIAGRLAVQIGTHLLHAPLGGKGLLLGGIPAAERGRVLVLGAGNAGGNAVALSAAMGAEVTVFDRNPGRLDEMRRFGNNVTALYPYPDSLAEAVDGADLLIGAVLKPGARAPRLISADQVSAMQAGSVIVDVSVDQGGCVETTRPTTYEAPTYLVDGVVHMAVTNMPGAVPRSASQALCASMMPYLLVLAGGDWERHPGLSAGVNLRGGRVVHPALKAIK